MEAMLESSHSRHGRAEQDAYLRHMIIEAMCTDASEREESSPLARRRAATKAREYIDAHFAEPVTMDMLCRHAGVSIRSLQRAFSERYEMSPMQYLKMRRLNAAHREFIHSNDGVVSIAEIAFQNGFNHLGRFAQEYRTLFHELPSETVLRKTIKIASGEVQWR